MQNQIKEYFFRTEFKELGIDIIKFKHLFSKLTIEERLQPHRIKFHAVLFITDGKAKHQVDFKNYDCKAGSLVFIGKEQIHSWLSKDAIDGYLILFTEDFLNHNQIKFNDIAYSYPYNSVLYKPILNIENRDDFRAFLSLVDYIFQELYLPQTKHKPEILQCLLRALLLKIQSNPIKELKDVDSGSVEIFIKFQRLLEKNFTETRNAADYCSSLNISFRKLNDICKILTKKTVKAFIDDFIILKAKRYLFNKELNVSEISYKLGFYEVTNFTKFFKNHENITPKMFRENEILKK